MTSDTLTPRLKAFPGKLDAALSALVEYNAVSAEGYGRQKAPWIDRTGNARQGLHSSPFHIPQTSHGFWFAHAVPYGIWLEVRFQGRYAIIMPTIRVWGRNTMAGARKLIARIR